MPMRTLQWIDDDALYHHIDELVERAAIAYNETPQRLVRNVVDPFLPLIAAHTLDLPDGAAVDRHQRSRSFLQSASTYLGHFHKNVLSSTDGWRPHDERGYDVECLGLGVIAELQNKHNTRSYGDARPGAVRRLRDSLRDKGDGWRAYLVEIVPSSPESYEEEIDENLFRVDGATFYSLASGSPTALVDLFRVVSEYLALTDSVRSYSNERFSDAYGGG